MARFPGEKPGSTARRHEQRTSGSRLCSDSELSRFMPCGSATPVGTNKKLNKNPGLVTARSEATKQSGSDVRLAARDCFAALAMTAPLVSSRASRPRRPMVN